MRLLINRDGSPIAARKLAAQIRSHARHRHQPSDLRPVQGLAGDQLVDRGDLCVQERDLPQAGIDRLALLERQLEISQPPAAHDAEQVSEPRLGLQPARQHRLDLVLGSGPPAHELLTARQAPAQHLAALIGHPDRVKLPLPQQPRQRPGVELVGLRAGARDAGVIRTDHDHLVHMRLEQPRDLPTAPRHLQRHPVGGQQALRQQPQAFRCTGDPARGADFPVLADRDHTEITVHIQADRPADPSDQRHCFTSTQRWLTQGGRTSGKTTRPIRALPLKPGKSQGRPRDKHGLEAHRQKRPTRLRSPKEAPVPDRRTVGPGPDGPSEKHFHAATSTSLVKAEPTASCSCGYSLLTELAWLVVSDRGSSTLWTVTAPLGGVGDLMPE